MEQAENDGELLYGAKAIATFLGIGEKAARHRIEAGVIPTFKLPGTLTICARKSSLRAWLAECEAKAQAAPKSGDGEAADG